MANMRQSYSQPVTHIAANPCMIISGSATTIGGIVMLENPNRRRGIWVQSTSVTNGRLLAGTTSSDCQILVEAFGAAGGGGANTVFIPGTGSLFLRGATTAVDWTAWEY